MTKRQQRMAEQLVAEIDSNIRWLRGGGFYEYFKQDQRKTWDRIGRAADLVKRRVNEILKTRHKTQKKHQSTQR